MLTAQDKIHLFKIEKRIKHLKYVHLKIINKYLKRKINSLSIVI